ncbi:MAG: tetratricopeptide repeat protein [Bacteroidia bacterium]|nr:tetratricopeptide repeat protein [Bacteroidia bacterium]
MKKHKNKSRIAETPEHPPQKRILLSVGLVKLFGAAIPLLALISGSLYWYLMRDTLGQTGLPFDESWIPLTFAKNLLAHGSYAYHSAGMVTSGAAAPLQVLLLALLGIPFGTGVTATFILGLISFALSGYVLFRLALLLFEDDQRFAPAVGLLFVASPLSVSAALSGLPSMLFTAFILFSALFYLKRKPLWFFVFAGLSVWVRPEGLIFIIAALLHLLYNHAIARASQRAGNAPAPASRRETAIGAGVAVLLIAGYALFNLTLGEGVFPNFVSAKLKYYSAASSDFWGDVLRFYSSSAHIALIVFAGLGVLTMLWNVLHRRQQSLLMSAAFIAGTIVASWLIFPFILSMHSLIATLPFFLLLSVWGMRSPWTGDGGIVRLTSSAVPIIIGSIAIVVALILSIADWEDMRQVHVRMVREQLERPVAAANWIAHNTSAEDAIATHFPGVMGYHTECRIVDMTGVVSPEIIPAIGNLPALKEILERERVEMIAAQRDHFEVVNVTPFWTSNRNAPPVMEIHPYLVGTTRIMSQRASSWNAQAAALMQDARHEEARDLLKKSYDEDPHSSRTNTLLGLVLLELKDTVEAEKYLREAVRLDPDYAPAMVPLGDILVARKDYWAGIPILEKAHLLNPSSVRARASWRNALRAQREDSLAAKGIYTFTITQ